MRFLRNSKEEYFHLASQVELSKIESLSGQFSGSFSNLYTQKGEIYISGFQ